MAKAKNYHVYGSVEKINRLKEEYEFIGRSVRVEEPGHLVVLAYTPKKAKENSDRDKRKPRGHREDRDSG